jgi:amino acid adenylation domain-containing protein
MSDPGSTAPQDKIAIIGMGCRFPGGASNPSAFWQNLVNGRDCITPTPADRYDVGSLGSSDKAKPGRLVGRRGGYIDGFDQFDPAFFGISPREADYMDPQQRKLLEVAWEALEDGGQKPLALAGQDVGVFVGGFTLDYKILQFSDLSFDTLAAHTATGTMMTMLSNRISHCFDFRGPSLSVDTACSSSLVAVHLACQSLHRRESCLALAGGALLHMTPQYTIAETKGGFLSAEGRSRTFDAAANGYVRAEGVGIVALKRLADALRDGDPIHAVIIGTGANQDGRTPGITVPSPQAQVRLIERVCSEAGILPGSLQYMEAHGTSTPVGDPIEAKALGQALSIGRQPGAKCYVGSVKTNIGHTEAAAGVAGLIKTTLSLKHRKIAPHINLQQVNPDIDLSSMPYEVPRQLTDWPEHDGPARAGVNSFGFGGTNAHVLLEEAPRRPTAPRVADTPPGSLHILPLSGRDAAALAERARSLHLALEQHGEDGLSLQDLGYTLAHRRQHLEARQSIVYDSRQGLVDGLAAAAAGQPHPQVVSGEARLATQRLVWVFTGMGPQWWAMGRQLFEQEPVYRDMVARCDQEIARLTGWSLIEAMNTPEAESQMSETWLAQPANFAVQVGLAALWRSRGVRPDAIVGHSTGEVAAFYEAGVYSLAQAVHVVVHRSRLQQTLVGTGTMLAVGLTEAQALRLIEPHGNRISVAAVNSPSALTLAGDEDALSQVADALRGEQVFAKFLAVRVPYHSAKMDLIKAELLDVLAELEPRQALVPLYTTARPGRAQGPELDAGYWWQNVRNSVGFCAAIDQIVADGHDLFLEIGPHPVLGHSIQECSAARQVAARTLPSIRRQEDERLRFTVSLAMLHNLGVTIDWQVLHPQGDVVPLPGYPWKRDRYWVEPAAVAQVRLGQVDHVLLGRRMAQAEPTWELQLDTEQKPYLNDHRIQGNVLFPAAGYIEMAVQAVRAMTGSDSAAISDIEFRKALFLPGHEAKLVQFSFSTDGASFLVCSPASAGQERTVHASGCVRVRQPVKRGEPLDVAALSQRIGRHFDGPQCYDALAAMGYHYGPAFRGIERVWTGPCEALARIRPAPQLDGGAAGHHVHPAVLDACFQVLLTPLILQHEQRPGDTSIRLPLQIDEVCLSPIGDQPLWVHATISRQDQDDLVGHLTVHADDGTPLGHIRGLHAGNIEKATAKVSLGTIDHWLAEMRWVELPANDDATPVTDATRPGGWMIFADAQGLGDELAAQVAARGERCHLVRPGGSYAFDPRRGESRVRPGCRDDLESLLGDLAQGDATPFDAIVHLWSLDLPAMDDSALDDLPAHTSRCAYALVALTQALLHKQAGGKLYIVTRGTQAVWAGEAVEPLGAPAWGVGRVLAHQELVSQRGKLIDLAAAGPADAPARRVEAQALLHEVLRDDEDEIALRGERRYASRLQPAASLARPLPLRLRSDGCYLVTGAFGALGQLLCRTLARRGARTLVLVGRSTLPERRQWRHLAPDTPAGRNTLFVKDLEALGAQAILAPLDITDEAALSAWLADFRERDLPPIRGVFHLAGQVRDTLVPEMTRETFDAVHDPKVAGAWLLHRLLADQPLEHFVLFASIAGLLTTAGQTNYAAGNAFLDALAHHRRARGLPALSLDWGPWATGMIEELGLIDHYRNSRGMSSLSPEAGMDVLERVIGQDCAQLLVATVVDWPIFLAWYAAPPRLVRELAAQGTAASSRGPGSFIDTFREADADSRRELLRERFNALVAQVLRVKPEQVEAGMSLNHLGLDSLLAMELRARVNAELKIPLPVVTLLSNTSVGALLDTLHAEMLVLVSAESGDDAEADKIEVITDERRYPLTQNQKALWFLKQLDPDGFAYNIGGAVEVRAALEPELMFAAVRALIDRHPSLRANFMLEDGHPVQRISDARRYDIAMIDVQGREWADIYQMIIGEYRKPYDLEHDPLVRFRLFKRAEDRWVIVKAVHHIISDAASTFTFIEELLSVYEGLRGGAKVELPPLRARYLDFLNWQNRFLAGREAQKMLGYWQSHLPAEVPVLNLPVDKPRPLVQTHNGASEFFTLDADLSARLHTLARENGVTVFMVLLSAYYILLSRHSGQHQVIVGSPVMGRTQEEFAGVYGYFVNPLPLHVDLRAQPSIAETLAMVQKTVLNGLDNQEYPFVLLVEKLGLKRDPSRSAVFQSMFILLAHKVATEKYGYRLEYVELPEEEGQFDLTLSAYEDEADKRFHCVFKYNSDLFVPATVQRLAGHYVNLLDALTRAPAGQSIAGLEMLGVEESRQIVDDWSGARHRLEAQVPVHALISQVARRCPDAMALTLPSESGRTQHMSYSELDFHANHVARRLRALGVGRGSVVALCLDKSLELVVTLLGVLKAGGAYLPLDPDYPAGRLQYMLSHADVRCAVVDASQRDRLGAWPGDVLALQDLHLFQQAGADGSPVDDSVALDDPAYVIYTSGSTGQPKAVQVSHGNLAAAHAGWQGEYRLTHDVHVHLQMASFAFDVFAGDLVRALCSGGRLVLVPRELLFNTARLYELMRGEHVDAAEFVPAVARGLMSYCENEGKRLDFMRLLMVGSDVWKVEEHRRLRKLCGRDTRVVNSYGLSETTIDSTYFEGEAQDLEPGHMVPVGRPFPNSAVYILDNQRRVVPAGVQGELWIGGAGVALGYLGDPEQTAQRFATVVLGQGSDAQPLRLYRTGDLARWNPNGDVQLLGRADHQIKVRGHRIEVGEIEGLLAAWPAVRQGVVTVRPDARGETTLCAYCVPADGQTLNRRELREHLSASLPGFMVPAHYVEVAALPLTPNGKVDLAALPAPEFSAVDGEFEPPVTLHEVRMAEHWKRLLGLDRVGLQHDFFEVGGSSIKLIELIYHLQAEFNIAIAVSQLFKQTTLHGMAKMVEDIVMGKVAGAQPYLRFNVGHGPTIFCFPPAGGHGLVYRQMALHMPEYEFVSFNYLGGDDKIERYADLIETQQTQGDCTVFGYSLGGNLAFEVAKELERRGRAVPNVVIMDSYRIPESFALGNVDFDAFERELTQHLHKHTGSKIVARETLAQARDYIHFCSRTPNVGAVRAPVSVISDEDKVSFYGAGERGTWFGSSTTHTAVFCGFGKHADMLDKDYVALNANLARRILVGEAGHAA